MSACLLPQASPRNLSLQFVGPSHRCPGNSRCCERHLPCPMPLMGLPAAFRPRCRCRTSPVGAATAHSMEAAPPAQAPWPPDPQAYAAPAFPCVALLPLVTRQTGTRRQAMPWHKQPAPPITAT